MSSRDHRPSHYAREAEVTRDRLASNLNELSDRLTPGQVFDEMLTYARGGGGSFLRTFSNAARENPIPSLLIGAGCMMFLSEKLGLNRMMGTQSYAGPEQTRWGYRDNVEGRYAAPMGEAASSTTPSAVSGVADATVGAAKRMRDAAVSGFRGAADFASDQTTAAGERLQHGAADVGETMAAASERIRRSARGLQDSVSDTASELMDSGRSMAGAVGGQVSDTAAMAQRGAVRATAKLKDGAASFIHEQPLLSAAMGVAIGAALAALLPSTETEDEMLGEASDSIKSALGDAGSQQFETLKGAAGAVMREAKNAAEREGLTPEGLAGAVHDIGEKVKNVAADVGASSSSQVEKVAGAGSASGDSDSWAPNLQPEGAQYRRTR